MFEKPNEVIVDRKVNLHFSFGIGVHRCVGSTVARTMFTSMLTAVLDRTSNVACGRDAQNRAASLELGYRRY